MSNFKKRFFPVIHCVAGNPYHAIENAQIAQENGADGVFLINHGFPSFDHEKYMVRLYEAVRLHFPSLWIGLNLLDKNHYSTMKLSRLLDNNFQECNAIWTDKFPTSHTLQKPKREVFGGVAFKYIDPNPSEKDLRELCEQAHKIVDVVTTSGDKTGSPPTIEKVKKIRSYISENIRLAVASGISVDNIDSLLEYVDDFLVASSIIKKDSDNIEWFIPEKVRELADIVHK